MTIEIDQIRNINNDINETLLVMREYAPEGTCDCQDQENVDGCPFCNQELIPAWRRSREMENHLSYNLYY